MSRREVAKKVFFFLLVLVLAAAVSLSFLLRREAKREILSSETQKLLLYGVEISLTGENEVSFFAVVSKEMLLRFFEERGVNISLISPILPEKFDVSALCVIGEGDGGGRISAEIKKARLGALSLPQKVLSDIGQINLDFKRSLVYN